MKSNPEGASSGRKVALGAMASGAANAIKARLTGLGEFGLCALALPAILIALPADGSLEMTPARDDESSTLIWPSAFQDMLT